MFILIAFLGYLALAVVALLDKFIVSEEKLSPALYVFYSTAPGLPILLLIPFGVHPLASAVDYGIALVAGFSFGLALWAMYKGFAQSEVSHSGPLVGAAIPFFTVFLSYLFLGERMSTLELVAIGVLILGSLIISFEQTRKNRGWHPSMAWLVVAGLGFALSNVASKYTYDTYGFYSGFVWTRTAIALFGVVMLLLPSIRRALFAKPAAAANTATPRKKFITVVADKGLGFLGAFAVQYAIAIGSVSIVNALSGLQYALLIILVALLTRFVPSVFKEDYRQGEFVQEGLAVIIISIGVALLLL